MKRKDREMNREFGLHVVDTCAYAVLSMLTPEGAPYAVPISIVRIGEDLYFHTGPTGAKIDALKNNPEVCLVCVGQVNPYPQEFTLEFESAILTGIAEEVEEEAEKIEVLRAVCMRYAKSHMDAFEEAVARSIKRTNVWRIRPETLTAKRKKYDPNGVEMKFARME